jgi:hypothetical protein
VEGGMEEKWKWKRKNRGNREGEERRGVVLFP